MPLNSFGKHVRALLDERGLEMKQVLEHPLATTAPTSMSGYTNRNVSIPSRVLSQLGAILMLSAKEKRELHAAANLSKPYMKVDGDALVDYQLEVAASFIATAPYLSKEDAKRIQHILDKV